MPLAVTVKVAFFPVAIVALAGGLVMAGAVGVVVPLIVRVMDCASEALPGLTQVTLVVYVPAVVGVPEI